MPAARSRLGCVGEHRVTSGCQLSGRCELRSWASRFARTCDVDEMPGIVYGCREVVPGSCGLVQAVIRELDLRLILWVLQNKMQSFWERSPRLPSNTLGDIGMQSFFLRACGHTRMWFTPHQVRCMLPIGVGRVDEPAADLVCIAVEDQPAAAPEREVGIGDRARLRLLCQPGAVGLVARDGAVLERDLEPALNSSSEGSTKLENCCKNIRIQVPRQPHLFERYYTM